MVSDHARRVVPPQEPFGANGRVHRDRRRSEARVDGERLANVVAHRSERGAECLTVQSRSSGASIVTNGVSSSADAVRPRSCTWAACVDMAIPPRERRMRSARGDAAEREDAISDESDGASPRMDERSGQAGDVGEQRKMPAGAS